MTTDPAPTNTNHLDFLFQEELLKDYAQRLYAEHREQAQQNADEANGYSQLAEVVKHRISQEDLAGDKPGSARRRASRASRPYRRLARLARKKEKIDTRMAAQVQSLPATLRSEVLNVPEKRELAASRKEQRRLQRAEAAGIVGSYLAKSLEKSNIIPDQQRQTSTLGPMQQQVLQPGYAQTYQFPMAAGAETQMPHQSLNDWLPKEGR